MVEEIWTKTPGMCKEDPISRERYINDNKKYKKMVESKKIGIYKKDGYNKKMTPEKQIEIFKKMYKGTTGKYTGISRGKNKNYLHNGIQIDNQNGINFTNNFSSMNNKKINFNEFTCYAPVPWEEYIGNCNGENIKKEVINIEEKKKTLFSNHYDQSCKEECLKDEKCQAYGTTGIKCTKYYGNIIGGDNQKGNYCKVKPSVYKYKNYEEIDNLYKKKMDTNKKIVKELNNKLEIDKNLITDKKQNYVMNSIENITDGIENDKINKQNLKLQTNYFTTLFNFHKQQSGKKIVDKKSNNVIGDIYKWNKNNLKKNDIIIKNIDENIDTIDRQGGITLNGIMKRDKIEIFMKLMLLYLVIWILLLFFKKINIIRDNGIINYIMFFVTVLIGGLIFIRFSSNMNRSSYNYKNKIFKHVKEPIIKKD